MLRLAVTTQAETYERMCEPLAEQGIEVVPVQPSERTVDLAGEPFPDVDVGFVFPPRLMEGGVVDAHLSVPWINDREAVLRSRNKADVLARLARGGVPVPETTMVSDPVDEGDLTGLFDRFDAPVVVKPNSTTRGVGVAKAHDVDSLLGIGDYLDLVHDYRATGDKSFLVQSFVPDARDVRVMVLDGDVVGAVERRLPADAIADGQWKHNVHRGADAVGIDLSPRLRALAARTAELLDVRFLGVDLLVTDDRALVSETNARPTIDSATKYEPGFWDRLASVIETTAAGEGTDRDDRCRGGN